MKALHRLGFGAAAAGLLVLAAGGAVAQQRPPMGLRTPPAGHGGHHGGRNIRGLPYYVVEREVVRVIEVEVPVPVAPPPPPAAPPEPRKPFVIGDSYASLPGGCMKLIEDGASYYYCGGDWYRQAGRHYEAVARP